MSESVVHESFWTGPGNDIGQRDAAGQHAKNDSPLHLITLHFATPVWGRAPSDQRDQALLVQSLAVRIPGPVLFVLLLACGDSDVAVDVTIDADPCTVDLTRRLVVRVLDELEQEVESFERTEGLTFPTGVRIVSSNANTEWVVEVEAFGEGDVPVGFQRTGGTFDATISQRAVLLDDTCFGIVCPDGTCVGGRCTDIRFDAVTPNPRPDACPGLAFADAEGGGAPPCGSAETPCERAQDAVATLGTINAGVLFLRGGATPYTETRSGGSVISLDGIEGLVVRAWPDTGQPLIDATGYGEGIDIDGANITIDGIEVRNADRHGININGPRNEGITVRNCIVYANGDSANMFNNHAGISTNNDAREILIENNIIRDNVTDLDQRCSGIHSNATDELVIRGNVVSGNSRFGIFTNNITGDVIENIIADNGSTGLLYDGEGEVRQNRICNSTDHGLVVMADATVSFNTVVDNATAGIRVSTDDVFVVSNNIIAFNGIGLEASGADPSDGPNLYFMNDMQFVGLTPDMPALDVVADPLLSGREDCTLELMEGSPARGATPETSFGARP